MRYRFLGAACLAVLVAACGGGGGEGISNLVVTASAPTDPVGAGTTAQLALDVANQGASAATGVAVSAALDARLTLNKVTCSASGGATCPSLSGADITVPALPAGGSLHFAFEVAVAANTRGTLVSTLTATAGNDATPADNTAQAVMTAYTADVSVWGYGPNALPHHGDSVDFTFVVTNNGPDTARNISIVDTLGPGADPGATITCRAGSGAECPVAVLGAAMTVPSLPSGSALTFTILATVASSPDSLSINNAMSVTAPGDPNDNNNSFGSGAGVLSGTP